MIKAAIATVFCVFLFAFDKPRLTAEQSPLAVYSAEWNSNVYQQCNTAARINYLADKEKEVIWILNMMRKNPSLFGSTVVKKYPEQSGRTSLKNVREYKSLLKALEKQQPLSILAPDSLSWVSAQCHATESGKKGYLGHDRQSKNCKAVTHFMGECCQYGEETPLDIVMSLLIDEGVPSLGHRVIFLSPYDKIGVSIQPHKSYRINTVIDFY